MFYENEQSYFLKNTLFLYFFHRNWPVDDVYPPSTDVSQLSVCGARKTGGEPAAAGRSTIAL